MKSLNSVPVLLDPKSRLCTLLVTACLICGVYFFGSVWLGKDSFRLLPGCGVNGTQGTVYSDHCKEDCRAAGSEALPKGIVASTSNLETRPLWGAGPENQTESKHMKNLLAVAVGIKQKDLVNKMVKKFLASNFTVILFHYDSVVDQWNDLEWYSKTIHVSAQNQTKWWFAKRFLHPDIVAEYDYIFLWDEDLDVENLDPERYLSIIKEEGLEISQPALDVGKSEVHHQITARRRKSRVHRRIYKNKGHSMCDDQSTSPPCVGWVEMMAPVFSTAAWRCSWYMIQNDLIHAWGLDQQLGYCAQGDRTTKVGVVDAEYVIHLGLPTLGGLHKFNDESFTQSSTSGNSSDSETETTTSM